MALHAAAVERGGKRFIFPGASGSGKSTLTVSLVYEGWGLYSDEIALLGEDGELSSVPYAMNLKEGSWAVAGHRIHDFDELDTFVRFDGQRVKMIPPRHLVTERKEVDYIVFPRYKRDEACRMEPLNLCETLRRIKEAGYQLQRPLDEESFDRIVDKLLAKPSYALVYGDLKDAKNALTEVMGG